MKRDWKTVRLGNVAKINPSLALKKGTVAKKVSMDKITPHCRDIVSYSEEAYSGGAKFVNGCTLMARITPCLENGKISQVRFLDKKEVAFGSTEFIVFDGLKGITDRDFVYYLVNTELVRQKAIDSMVGSSGRQRAQSDEVANIEFPLPPLPTQRKIAAVLGSIDDKIENNRKICANLEAQAQALFKSWFVDFDPFDGKMPEGWKMGKLGDVADCNPPRYLRKGTEATCVEMADLVTTGSFPSSWRRKVYAGGMKFQNGDTIIARITPCFENGKVAYINFLEDGETAFGSTEYVVVATRSNVPSELFYCLAKCPDFISYAKSRMVGSSGRQRFSAEDIASYPITIASDRIYDEIRPVLRSGMEQIKELGFESRALASLRDALLPKLMSGEIDVERVEV